jgi:glycosyltransferase involved in cell wall biosynthesis
MSDPRLSPTALSVLVIVPAYNEATTIGAVVASLVAYGYRVVVVDDGSCDDTGREATHAGATVVTHPINLGQGAALQTGLCYALQNGSPILVTFDADGQHRASDIRLLVEALQQEEADFALGSRFLGRCIGGSWARRTLLRAATLFTRLTTQMKLTDTHNGLRAMTRRGAAAIRLRQNRMAHASEILEQIARSGLRYVEVPTTVEYTAYSKAKGQRLSDALVILTDLFAERLYR